MFIHKDNGDGTLRALRQGHAASCSASRASRSPPSRSTVPYNTGTAAAVIDIPGFLTKTVATGELQVTGTLDIAFSGLELQRRLHLRPTGTAPKGDLRSASPTASSSLGEVLEVDNIDGTLHEHRDGHRRAHQRRHQAHGPGRRALTARRHLGRRSTPARRDARHRAALGSSRPRSTSRSSGRRSSGTFRFEQVTAPAAAGATPAKIVRVAATDVHLFIGDEAAGAGVELTQRHRAVRRPPDRHRRAASRAPSTVKSRATR